MYIYVQMYVHIPQSMLDIHTAEPRTTIPLGLTFSQFYCCRPRPVSQPVNIKTYSFTKAPQLKQAGSKTLYIHAFLAPLLMYIHIEWNPSIMYTNTYRLSMQNYMYICTIYRCVGIQRHRHGVHIPCTTVKT